MKWKRMVRSPEFQNRSISYSSKSLFRVEVSQVWNIGKPNSVYTVKNVSGDEELMTKFAAMMAVDDLATKLQFDGEVKPQLPVDVSAINPSIVDPPGSDKPQILELESDCEVVREPVDLATQIPLAKDSEVNALENNNVQGTTTKLADIVSPSSVTPQKRSLEPAHVGSDEPALKHPTL